METWRSGKTALEVETICKYESLRSSKCLPEKNVGGKGAAGGGGGEDGKEGEGRITPKLKGKKNNVERARGA